MLRKRLKVSGQAIQPMRLMASHQTRTARGVELLARRFQRKSCTTGNWLSGSASSRLLPSPGSGSGFGAAPAADLLLSGQMRCRKVSSPTSQGCAPSHELPSSASHSASLSSRTLRKTSTRG